MVETALILPIFIMFTFAVIDFGNYLIVKNRIVSANQAIASAVQNNPTMTLSQMTPVIGASLGDLWTKGYTSFSVWSSKTPPNLDFEKTQPNWWKRFNLANPWLSDADPSNDNKAYYVGVWVGTAVPWLTPLPKLLGLDVIDADNQYGNAPTGRKSAESFTLVTLNNASCPADQVLQSMTGGAAVCVNKDRAGLTCPDGEFVYAVIDGLPSCRALIVKADTDKRFRPNTRWPEIYNDCNEGTVQVGNSPGTGSGLEDRVWCADLIVQWR